MHSSPRPPTADLLLIGIDFSSAPTRRKPITAAFGRRRGQVLQLDRLEALPSLAEFEALLARPGPWLAGCDFPFGLPRELVETLDWPRADWASLIRHYASLDRATIRAQFAAFCAARPAGAKFAHRASDAPAGASPSMKWVNPPVAYMLHAGAPRLLAAGVSLPGLQAGDPARVALEAYPGLLARELLGRRSYKSDDAAKQDEARLIARKDLVDALEQGRSRLGMRFKLSHAQREALVDDARGDLLDAVLCLLQAGWAAEQPGYGLPPALDPVEGWIISAEFAAGSRG